MMPKEQLQDVLGLLLEERVVVYDLLRLVFQDEPSKGLIQTLVGNPMIADVPFADEDERISQGCKQVRDYLANLAPVEDENEQEYQRVHWDYTKMFIGPGELIVPPWESVYTTKERLIFQETTLEVRKAYLKYNFLPKQYLHEADDHIGLELEFMYRLSEQALKTFQNNELQQTEAILKDQQQFLREHLQLWIPEFSEKVINGADTDLYRGMANVLNGIIDMDAELLEEIISYLK